MCNAMELRIFLGSIRILFTFPRFMSIRGSSYIITSIASNPAAKSEKLDIKESFTPKRVFSLLLHRATRVHEDKLKNVN